MFDDVKNVNFEECSTYSLFLLAILFYRSFLDRPKYLSATNPFRPREKRGHGNRFIDRNGLKPCHVLHFPIQTMLYFVSL